MDKGELNVKERAIFVANYMNLHETLINRTSAQSAQVGASALLRTSVTTGSAQKKTGNIMCFIISKLLCKC